MTTPTLDRTLSFVIPAFNEADGIARCVTSIRRHAPEELLRDIIVVDNGSHDDTATLARDAGARVIASEAKTIAGVRNEGVEASSGNVLVFIDADCVLTAEWGSELGRVLDEMASIGRCCAGSQVFPPADDTAFLWKYWFLPFVTQESASHVGSANMVCSRDDFLALGGFDEQLETGEDFDFCARIQKSGGSILNVPAMRVEHYGFPRSWRDFMKRERWHGRGDVMSLTAFFSSKVAVAGVLFVSLVLGGAIAVVAGFQSAGLIALAAAALLLLAASLVKFRHAGLAVLAASLVILPVYFVARTLSALDALTGRTGR